ncbi:MAG: hypothetical protein WC975_10645 [Phycisphaerae bacterium]
MVTQMLIYRYRKFVCVLFTGLLLVWPVLASSQTAATQEVSVPPMAEEEKIDQVSQAAPELPERPFSLAVTYYLLSDYVYRGVNFSEYSGEGREKLNHQMATSIDIPLGKKGNLGNFGFDTFFEWFAQQDKLETTPPGHNLQEIDYTLRYSYDVEPIKTKATVGWTDFTFPRILSSHDRTNEWFIRLEHNDAWMWRGLGYKGEDGILNPSFCFTQDTGYILGQWYEVCVKHPVTLCKNVTWTPQCVFAFDGGYIQPSLNEGKGSGKFEYAYTQPGMELKYDLTELLHLPPQAGSVYISGQLYYNAVSAVEKNRNEASHQVLKDLLFGGLAVGWSW